MPLRHLSSRTFLLALLLTALWLANAAPADAAYPGRPGPIAYPQSTSRVEAQLVDGETKYIGRTENGLFVHGLRAGLEPWQLTSEADRAPSYSPDGRRIVFVGERGQGLGDHLYVMAADGSGIRQLTSGGFVDGNPYFSPDGRRIVFQRQSRGRPIHIFIVGIDGSGLRQLTRGPQSDWDPTFSPSGKRIVYASDRNRDGYHGRSDIWAMGSGGEDPKPLIDGPRGESEPDFSPDGRQIVFIGASPGKSHVYIARSNGRRVRALTDGSCRGSCYSGPAWSPGGRQVAALRSSSYTTTIQVLSADGERAEELASGSVETEGIGTTLGPPTWGPGLK